MNPLLFFFQSASAGGVLLFLAAILGLVMANTGLAPYYEHFLHAELGPLPVHLWINDVLMAIFFLQVGLEVKRVSLRLGHPDGDRHRVCDRHRLRPGLPGSHIHESLPDGSGRHG